MAGGRVDYGRNIRMITISSKKTGPFGDLWLTQYDAESVPAFARVFYFIHKDFGQPAGEYLQNDSDLDLYKMPYHFCRVPSVFFYPYVTYFTGVWFQQSPSFVILKSPLDRLKARYWLDGRASDPIAFVSPDREKFIDTQLAERALAIKTYFLDDIRYVYDETQGSFDSSQTNTPSRFQFPKEIAEYEITKNYLNWYINQFDKFFSRLMSIVNKDDETQRKLCLVAGLTINRLAIDTVTILSTDVPYIRKWQFFGLLDALAALKNELDGTGHGGSADRETAKKMLSKLFLKSDLLPTLAQIPIPAIREQIIDYTGSIYNAIDGMKTNKHSGPELLWFYRNARHGYAIHAREDLFLHSGKIPNNLPDLVIALWHYILLNFPFNS